MKKFTLDELGTATGGGCGKVPHPNCQACIQAQAYLEISSCGLSPKVKHHERKFTEMPRRHCSRCPYPEGCMMCDL